MIRAVALAALLATAQGPKRWHAKEGYQHVLWGMSPEEVHRVLPSTRKEEQPDVQFGCGAVPNGSSLVEDTTLSGFPVREYFEFDALSDIGEGVGLSTVTIMFTTSDPAVAYEMMKSKLREKYGAFKDEPGSGLEEDPRIRDAKWQSKETTRYLMLTKGADGQHPTLSLQYRGRIFDDSRSAKQKKQDDSEL